jgi:MYXO-CTERM domain-containing protein
MGNTTRRILLGTVGSLVLGTVTREAGAVDYEVGPGQTYANITDVPLGSLQPGDNVLIHWQADPYRETFGIDRAGTADQPITVRGVPNAQGALPAIDGENSSSGYGSHARGLIHVSGNAAYVVIENLELRNAHADYGFPDNAASVFAPEGSNLTFRNLDIHHSGNGFFTWVYSSNVLVEGCHIHDNGNVGSLYEHNIYTESDGIIFQYNRIMPLMTGAGGNNLKDRSTGLVVRYNWIEGGNRALDLVESEDGSWDHTEGPDLVYGNVLIKHEDTGQSQVVHFGGDNAGIPEDRTFLYFYHNTVYSDRPDGTTLFFVNAAAEVDAHNNIFYGPNATVELIDPDDSSAATLELGNNWISSGYVVGSSQATINGEGNLITGSDPGLAAVPTDFTPTAGSPPVDAGTALPSGVSAYPADREYLAQGESRARTDSGNPDLGAYALDSAGGATGSGGSGATGSGGAAGEPAGGSGGAAAGGTAGAAAGGSAGAATGGSAGTAAGGTPAGGSSGAAAGGATSGGAAGNGTGGASGNPPVGVGGTNPAAGGTASGGAESGGSAGDSNPSGGDTAAGGMSSGGSSGSAAGGRESSAGASSGGSDSTGGSTASGGSAALGGTSNAGAGGGLDEATSSGSSDDGGCGCSVPGSPSGSRAGLLAALLALAWTRRRRSQQGVRG